MKKYIITAAVIILLAVLIFVVVKCVNWGVKLPLEITETYTDEDGNEKTFTYVTRETSDKFTLFENALTEKGIVFTKEQKSDGIIDGAVEGRKYKFETGETFEIFKFDVTNEAYKEMAKTSKMYMEMFDAYIDVAVNDEYALIPANVTDVKEIFLNIE